MTVPTVVPPLGTQEVHLYGKQYWLKGQVRKRKTTQWAAPIRTGNPERADQQFASEVIWDDLTGGAGVISMDERENPDRFADSAIDTRVRKQLVLLPKRNRVVLAGVGFSDYPCGGVDYGGDTYVVGGTTLKRLSGSTPDVSYYDTGSSSWVTSGGPEYSLPDDAVSRPIVWKDNVWVPCGGGGLVRYDTAAETFATISGVEPAHLFIFDEDLCLVNTDGTIQSTDDNTTSPSWTDRGSIDTFTYLNGAVVWQNGAGDPAPWIATDRGLHTLNYWTQKVYDSGVQFTDGSQYNGKGLTVWDGRLWHGKGANAHEIVDGARIVRGPNNGDGLVTDKQGHVVSFNTSFDNYLLAAIDAGTGATSSLMAYNRRGWHTLVSAATPTTTSALDALGLAVVGTARVGFAEVGQPRVAAFDDFDGANSSTTLGTALVGGAWTAGSGTWGITSNTAYLTADYADAVAVLETSVADCTVQATFTTNVAGQRLVVRYADASNYLYVQTTSTGYDLGKRDTGVDTVLASAATTPADGDVVRVILVGSSVRLLVNGYELATLTSVFNLTETKHGIGSALASTPRWNDVIVGAEYRRITWSHYSPLTTPGYLYFNEGTNLLYVRVSDTSDNAYQAQTYDFEPYGYLILPWFDAGLAEVQKTGLSVQVRTVNTSATATVRLYYQTDDGATWSPLLDANGTARTIDTAGVETLYFDADQLGTQFYNVRLKVELESASPTVSPRVVFVKIRYLRDLPVLYGYDVTLDLTKPQPDGRTYQQAVIDLETAVESRLMGKFAYLSGRADDTKTVLILQYGGPWDTGTDRRLEATLSLVEVVPQA